MRILLINYEYPPVGGGASNATWEIARAMVKIGHEPIVLTARYKHRERDTANSSIKVIEVPALRRRKDRCSILEMTTFVLSAILRIRGLIRREKIEGMIAFFSIPCGPIAWWGWRAHGTRYVVSLRGGDVPGTEPSLRLIHRLLGPFRRTVLQSAAAVVTNSPALQSAAERADTIPTKVFPNGIDSEFWNPRGRVTRADHYSLLFVGRLQRQKNLGWLLQQLGLLDGQLPLPWALNVVGDGPLREDLEKLISATPSSRKVHWHGWVSRNVLRDLYWSSQLLVIPSTYEGMSNAVLEALGCGLPVLMSDAAAAGDSLFSQPGVTVFEAGNAQSFARGLVERMKEAPTDSNLRLPPQWVDIASAYKQLLLPD